MLKIRGFQGFFVFAITLATLTSCGQSPNGQFSGTGTLSMQGKTLTQPVTLTLQERLYRDYDGTFNLQTSSYVGQMRIVKQNGALTASTTFNYSVPGDSQNAQADTATTTTTTPTSTVVTTMAIFTNGRAIQNSTTTATLDSLFPKVANTAANSTASNASTTTTTNNGATCQIDLSGKMTQVEGVLSGKLCGNDYICGNSSQVCIEFKELKKIANPEPSPQSSGFANGYNGTWGTTNTTGYGQ